MGTYPEKNIVQNDTCTPVFTAALFTTAKILKKPKCPSTDEWIKKMWYGVFPVILVVKIQCFHWRGHGFDPWLGNQDPACCAAWQKKKKNWYIYTMEYYPAMKKNEIKLFAKWMDLEIIILSEVNHTEKEKCQMI